MKMICVFALAIFTVGCTDNVRTKFWGGTTTHNLPAGQKLVNVTWKEANIWYLTRPMNSNDTAETYMFQENSSFGVLEGKVLIQEHR